MGKRHFNNSWLEKTDSNGYCVNLWCVKKDENTATCTLLSEGYKYCIHGIWYLEPTCRKAEAQRICRSLVKIKTEEKTKTDVHEKEAKQTEEKSTQKVIQEFFYEEE